MLHKMKDALPEWQDHQEALDNLEEGLRGEYSAALIQWREQVEALECDPAKSNPFERRVESMYGSSSVTVC
jgi:hypothetical protein